MMNQDNTAATPASSAIVNTQVIGNYVRYWVHYDTMLTQLNKQVRQLRSEKDKVEEQLFAAFQASKITSPVIQIHGGRLIVSKEKSTTPLTFKNLEIFLHQYYRQRPGTRDETNDIINFVKAQRETIETPVLKRIITSGSGTAAPPTGTQ
jgi:hypothetical protein